MVAPPGTRRIRALAPKRLTSESLQQIARTQLETSRERQMVFREGIRRVSRERISDRRASEITVSCRVSFGQAATSSLLKQLDVSERISLSGSLPGTASKSGFQKRVQTVASRNNIQQLLPRMTFGTGIQWLARPNTPEQFVVITRANWTVRKRVAERPPARI